MNIGQKIAYLKENIGFKNYQDFGKHLDIPGDWLLDLSKKQEISTVDISRLRKIVEKCEVTFEWLLSDEIIKELRQDLPEDDIGIMLDQIQERLKLNDLKYYGESMNTETIKLARDSIDVVKGLIKSNI